MNKTNSVFQININIVTFNDESIIENCLQAVFAQTYKNFSVLCVDNFSKDNTLKILKQWPVKVIKNYENKGFAIAHNQALRATNGEFVLLLNPDIRIAPTFLEEMIKVFNDKENNNIGSASGCLLRINKLGEKSKIIDGCGLFMNRNRRQNLIAEGLPLEKFKKRMNNKLCYIFGPDGAAPFFRRKMLEDIKMNGEFFDEDFYINKEDVDLCWRSQIYGWQSLLVPKAKAFHIRTFRAGTENRKKVPLFIRRAAVRNRYLLLLKNEHWIHFLRDFPLILIYEIKIFIYLILFEPSSLIAYIDVLKLFKRTMKKRKIIQSKRKTSWQRLDIWFKKRF